MHKGGEKIRIQRIKNFIPLLLISLVIVFCVCTVSATNEIYVNTTGNDTSGTGTADNPYLTIQKGVDNLDPNGVINIADGQYSGVNNTNITINKNMTITGQSQTGTIINGTNTNWIFQIPNDVSVFVMNLTIVNGYRDYGSAIFNRGNLTVTDCNFTNNTADYCTIYNVGSCTVTGCTFTGNKAYKNCGAIGSGGGICIVTDCIFSNNKATIGGAIVNSGGIFTVTGCTFTDNSATDRGGAIASQDNTLSAHYNRFYNNTATAGGNAIYCQSSSVNATLNWWGSNTDPSTIPKLILADPGASVWSDPWLYMTINATPTIINNTQTSLITVSFNNYSSDGTTYTEFDPSLGHIPDGIPVTFSLTKGPFGTLTAPFTVNILGGLASILFTASNVGVQDVNGTLDDQNVTASISILAAHVDLDTFYADYDEFINNNHNIVPITGPVNYLDHVIVVFKATNMGPNPVTYLVLREDWPSELIGTGDVWHTFDGINWNQESYLAQGSFNMYPTYAGPLDMGDVCLCVFGATVNASNTIITSTVSTTEQEPIDDEGFDTASADLEVKQYAAATITKTANINRPNVGETVIFTIVTTNNGPDTANNMVVIDTLPVGLDFVSCTDGGVWDPVTRTVTWPSAVVLNGANVTYYLTALVNSTSFAGTNVTNVVNETHTEYPNNSTTNCTIYVPKSDLYIQITSNNNNPTVGETFTLRYKLGNKGPDDALNVTITIPIPDGFVISKIEGDGTWTIVGNNIIWTMTNVTVGDPDLYVSGWTRWAGSFLFSASITSDTFNLNSLGVSSFSLNTIPQVNAATTTTSSNSVGMQTTGAPLAPLVLAILSVLSGLMATRKK
ncbi:right-handed parallel beta-helix repeat-containing protein [Methanobacterium sp.]|uniref:right-handed parallel beta-helix repeat-containing protein n=1 Tax=Methanobacterium sp. TaxID=2164 RepID=UPI0025DF1BB2|nr:right-handed parallel beta-helix repeat-containing protein [Methanobacterium sp.]MBI5459889.1 DUF11 domain-containing protein [Methanobacterium sp.]